MNRPSSGSPSGRPSPRNTGENLPSFLDFSQPPQQSPRSLTTSSTSTPQSQESQTRTGGIRVSLACIPCRSRHVKCGAEVPNCSRCVQDDKPCFYAKSRRGMRDRNAARGKAPLRDGVKDDSYNSQMLNPVSTSVGQSSAEPYNSFTGPSSNASNSPGSLSSRVSDKSLSPRRLLDLYYNFFHKAHPYVLPRYNFQSRLETDPDSLKFLLPVMQYIGSLFAPDISSSELKDVALSNLELSALPPNGFTVQALLLAAIATHSEDEMERGRALLDRAVFLSLELHMNSRSFAQMDSDLVLAESWRRTYWGLYITDGAFARMRGAPTFILYTIEANVELPCEEYEYENIIPRPRMLPEYESRDFEEHTTVFSSFTYLIDLTRISGALLGLDRLSAKDLELAVTNADAMLVNWKLHLPREKQGVVDRGEEIDEILFQAQNLLQILFILIHRPLSRLLASPFETLSHCTPPSHLTTSPSNTHSISDRTYWLHTKKTLDAAEVAINYYALPCSILQHTPLVMCGLSIATMANLSACAYLLSGNEWGKSRDRISLGIGGLKAYGEVWSRSRRVEGEVRAIARGVFGMERAGGLNSAALHGTSGVSDIAFSSSGVPTTSGHFAYDFEQGNIHGQGHGLANGIGKSGDGQDGLAWPDLQELEYLNMMHVVEQQRLRNQQGSGRGHS